MVGIMNEAARRNGYADISVAWKETLAIPDIDSKIAELYADLLPFYRLLHGFVRHRLRQYYGSDVVPDENGPIPAHLLGNLWGQTWSALSADIAVAGKEEEEEANATAVPSGVERRRPPRSLSQLLRDRNYNVMDIMRTADDFYQSLGLDPMTATFWERSQFVRPKGNNGSVAAPTSCHPSAIDLYAKDDFRIEMCGERTEETFLTAHHEMGHVQYYMNYAHLPAIFRDGANPAFHEAVGDAINYAVRSPVHLKRLDLWDTEAEDSISPLLQQALYRVPLIPWSLVVDRWRWDVFAGRVDFANWNDHWWTLRERLQGVASPIARASFHLDPLAKFHIPDNTPYMPYFFSSFLQVQIFEGLCKAKYGKMDVDLHSCDLYKSKDAGDRLRSMLSLGQSRPWQDALEAITGEREISSAPLLRYYRPLILWLEKKVAEEDIQIGW